ncbi:MAG: hypothetical protein AAF600_21840 [Bacteroidota bacterium]
MKNLIVFVTILYLPGILDAQVIDTGDKVGIGVTNPTEKLDVNGVIKIRYGSDSWRLVNNSDGSFSIKETGFGGSLNIYQSGNANVNLLNLNEGRFGVGTTSPIEKLDVTGNIQIGANNFLKGKRSDGLILNLVGYIPDANGGHLSISEYSSVPSEVRIFTPTDANQGVSIYSDRRLVFFRNDGNVGIGVDNPDSKLVVNGKIRSEEVKVEIINGPDYVFESGYKLRTLKETKEYIVENKHLPELPTAKEMEANGVDLGDMNMRLLKKIEELTLYQIELLERIEKLESKNDEIEDLKKKIELIEKK